MRSLLLFALLLSINTFASENYFEFCAGSQINFKYGAVGGSGGHGFFYVHGLCKDYSKNFPQVIPCHENSNHEGVGITLDSGFKNVSWVAVPGRNLTLWGNLSEKPNSFTVAEAAKIINNSKDLRIFEGIEYHKKASKLPVKGFADALIQSGVPPYIVYGPQDSLFDLSNLFKRKEDPYISLDNFRYGTENYEKFVAMLSIGTDIAIGTGRDLVCARMKFDKSKIQTAADYLNEINKLYYNNEKIDYVWSGIFNNCSHLAVNTAYKLGVSKKFIKTNQKVKKGKIGKIITFMQNTFSPLTETDIVTPADLFLKFQKRNAEKVIHYPLEMTSDKNDFFKTEDLKVFSLGKFGKIPIKELIKN